MCRRGSSQRDLSRGDEQGSKVTRCRGEERERGVLKTKENGKEKEKASSVRK